MSWFKSDDERYVELKRIYDDTRQQLKKYIGLEEKYVELKKETEALRLSANYNMTISYADEIKELKKKLKELKVELEEQILKNAKITNLLEKLTTKIYKNCKDKMEEKDE